MKMAYKLLDGTKMLRSLRVSGCRIIKWLPAAFSIRAAAGKRTGFVIVQIPPESIARSDNVDCQKRFAGYGEEKNWYTVDIIN